jgi:hypothetical protein
MFPASRIDVNTSIAGSGVAAVAHLKEVRKAYEAARLLSNSRVI